MVVIQKISLYQEEEGKMNERHMDVVNYVRRASELAACVEKDVKDGKKTSSATVLALSNFLVAQQKMQFLLDQVEKDSIRLN